MKKIYIFGDMIKESYLIKAQRHGVYLYDQNARVELIDAGTALIYRMLDMITKSPKTKTSFLGDISGYSVEKIYYDKDCPFSYSTLNRVKNRNNESILRIIVSDGYNKTQKSTSYPCALSGEGITRFDDDDVVIINDKGLAFADNDNKKLDEWLKVIFANPKTKKIINVSEKYLLEFMNKIVEYAGNDTENIELLMSLDSVRRRSFLVSKKVSWEKTAYDLYNVFRSNEKLQIFRVFKNITLFCGMEGALYMDNDKYKIIFSPDKIEGDTMGRIYDFVEDVEELRLIAYLIAHLGKFTKSETIKYALYISVCNFEYGCMRLEDIASEIIGYSHQAEYSECDVPIENITGKLDFGWTILKTKYPDDNAVYDAAVDIVENGIDRFFSEIPVLKINALQTVDRNEIESYRAINVLMQDYLENTNRKTPISIAVFGEPGTGKSFGIKQIIKSLPFDTQIKEINLSQIQYLDDLVNTFEEIQDISVTGKVPIVFFDEFDSEFNGKSWGFVKYFLAPMQDGCFINRGMVKPLGRGIYIFAGATKTSFKELQNISDDMRDAFVKAKVPDFISRLRGYLDIKSINSSNASDDKTFVIKRALLLRSLLERNAPNLFSVKNNKKICNIDRKLLLNILNIPTFKYGVRSMEQLILMSELKDEFSYLPSMLPTEPQLDLHVDSKNFFKCWSEKNK